jgi:hypothetical protein
MEFDSGRVKPVLDGAARESLGFQKAVLPSLLGEYAKCLVARLD